MVRTMSSCSARFNIREIVACDMWRWSAISACRLPLAVIHLRDPGNQP